MVPSCTETVAPSSNFFFNNGPSYNPFPDKKTSPTWKSNKSPNFGGAYVPNHLKSIRKPFQQGFKKGPRVSPQGKPSLGAFRQPLIGVSPKALSPKSPEVSSNAATFGKDVDLRDVMARGTLFQNGATRPVCEGMTIRREDEPKKVFELNFDIEKAIVLASQGITYANEPEYFTKYMSKN
ncbi:hypothetical protein QR680_018323 [Steinernema hermaphroditum]|uniref:Uncharacterized protein n=1 Tax=Steinernema hermaphroditum TaxID=289476 RepID=A0AA39LQX9_9BILA|nr:hypothetical protein QR680_018323 [Steinernema hermaphroditum]